MGLLPTTIAITNQPRTKVVEKYGYTESFIYDKDSLSPAMFVNASANRTDDKNHIQPIDKNQSKDEIIVSSKSGTVNVSNSNKVAQDVSKVTSDFNGDGYEDQAIGAHEDVGNVGNAGAVHIIYGSPDGLSPTAALPDQLWTQESAFIQGSAELRDHFGELSHQETTMVMGEMTLRIEYPKKT